jgi:hypothetical protein
MDAQEHPTRPPNPAMASKMHSDGLDAINVAEIQQ